MLLRRARRAVRPTAADPAPGSPAPRRRRRLWPRLLLAAVTALVSLEIALRAFDVHVPMARIWRWHPTFGWTQDPGRSFDYVVDGEPVHASFNALGFRDVEHARAKPAGTRRIVLLGDSYCEAVQVNFEDTFYRRLARELGAEVINLGVGDWGQAQQLLVLRELGLGYEPDLVICQLLPLNDICNNCLGLAGVYRSHNDFYRPYFVEREGGLVQTWQHPWRQRLRQLSRIWLNAERVVERWQWSSAPGSDPERWAARAEAAGFTGLHPLLQTFLPDGQQHPKVRAGWSITERLLAEMAGLCRARGIPFLLLVVAWEARVGEAFERLRAAHPELTASDLPEQRLARWGGRHGVPVVLTRELFEERIDQFLPCRGGHLGPGGHALVAEALRAAIEARGLLR